MQNPSAHSSLYADLTDLDIGNVPRTPPSANSIFIYIRVALICQCHPEIMKKEGILYFVPKNKVQLLLCLYKDLLSLE